MSGEAGDLDRFKILDAWLRLRAATEQRTNWFYAALFLLFSGVVAGLQRLLAIGQQGRQVIVVVGVVGLIGGIGVAVREFSDENKLDALVPFFPVVQRTTQTATHDAFPQARYSTWHLTSLFMIAAGVGFFIVMLALAGRLPECVVSLAG